MKSTLNVKYKTDDVSARPMRRIDQIQQGGFVSIVVTIIIMTILSLITLGFAQLMGREQRQALDRVLSTQAFYAAESGVNDAILNPASYNDTSCTARDVDSSLGVRNTCVTYDNTPDNHSVDAVPINQFTPDVFPLPAGAASMRIDFRSNSPIFGGAAFRINNSLPPFASWGTNPGALKVQVIPFRNSFTRQDIIDSADSFVVIPRQSGANGVYGGAFGRTEEATCDAVGFCTITITGLPTAGNTRVKVVMSSLYSVNSVTTTAFNGSNTLIPFTDDQAVIDSTGRTTDVLRRVQVRVSLIPQYVYSPGGITATGSGPNDGVCKLIQAAPSPALTTNSTPCSTIGL